MQKNNEFISNFPRINAFFTEKAQERTVITEKPLKSSKKRCMSDKLRNLRKFPQIIRAIITIIAKIKENQS